MKKIKKRYIALAIVLINVVVFDQVTGWPPTKEGTPPDYSGSYKIMVSDCEKRGCYILNRFLQIGTFLNRDGINVRIQKVGNLYKLDSSAVKRGRWRATKEGGTVLDSIGIEDIETTVNLDKNNVGWTNNSITVKEDEWIAFLGVGKQTRTAQLVRNTDGKLILHTTFRESALAFFIFPFTEKHTEQFTLVPIT